MEYQKKKKDLLDNKPNQQSKFRKKNWDEIKDDSHGACSIGRQIRFKTMMLNSSLCDYSDTSTLISGTITITVEEADNAAKWTDKRDKEGIFKNCAPFTKCITEISNTQVDNAQ